MSPFDDQSSLPQTELFEAIPRDSTLASRVVEQIEGLIIEGRLHPGDLLPERTGSAIDVGPSFERPCAHSLPRT
jgi:hypothetical protein